MVRISFQKSYLEIITFLRWTGLHEVLILIIETSALKHVQYIVYVKLRQAIRHNSASEVRVTMIVSICSDS